MPHPTFHIWFTVTGPLAQGVLGTVKVPFRSVYLLREQEMPLARLWLDRSKADPSIPERREGLWTATDQGSSIFDPRWSLSMLERWIESFGKSREIGDIIIADVEDIHPFAFSQASNGRANFDAMRSSLRSRGLVSDGFTETETVAVGLRRFWKTLLDGLESYGLDVSVYGHTPDRAAAPLAQDQWFYRRLRRTHPVLYEWTPNRPAPEHRRSVAVERTRAAHRVAPLTPCMPFVTPVLDHGDRKSFVTPAHFRGMVEGAREAGASGVVVWYHAQTVHDVLRWSSNADWINDALAG